MIKSYKKIAIALDFSEQSMKAFRRAVEIAKMNGATLQLVTVVDTKSFGSVAAYDLKYGEKLKLEYQSQMEKLKIEVLEAGVTNVEISIEAGAPKEILTQLPEVNLLTCGATGVNRLEKMVIGSVAERIVRHSKYDVLIVR